MTKKPLFDLLKGSVLATAAALLAPFSVLFLVRGSVYAVAAIGAVQLVLLGVGFYLMWAAHKALRR